MDKPWICKISQNFSRNDDYLEMFCQKKLVSFLRKLHRYWNKLKLQSMNENSKEKLSLNAII